MSEKRTPAIKKSGKQPKLHETKLSFRDLALAIETDQAKPKSEKGD